MPTEAVRSRYWRPFRAWPMETAKGSGIPLISSPGAFLSLTQGCLLADFPMISRPEQPRASGTHDRPPCNPPGCSAFPSQPEPQPAGMRDRPSWDGLRTAEPIIRCPDRFPRVPFAKGSAILF